MLTKTAKEDLKALRACGFNPTDEEIVHLNDIAIRIERGRDTSPASMPRVAFAGSIVLHEPTIGAMEWWLNYGQNAFWSSKSTLLAYYFMLAHSKDVEWLNGLDTPKAIRREVRKWKKTLDCTEDELWRALCWVKYGDGSIDENPDRDEISSTIDDEERMNSLWMTVIAAAGAMGMKPDDLKTQTESSLVGMLIHSNLHAHIPMKQSIAKDYIAYRQLMKKIEDSAHAEKEVENG